MADKKKKKEVADDFGGQYQRPPAGERGGGFAPKTKVRFGPDRRAQATLRAAERPKASSVTYSLTGSRKTTSTTVRNPAVGVEAVKRTRSQPNVRGTDSTLEFNRYRPGSTHSQSYSTKKQREQNKPSTPTVDSRHKDRLRAAAVRHATGRQLTDVRPGNSVTAHAMRSGSPRNARARAYEQQTNGALNFERGRQDSASSTKLTKTSWQPSNTNQRVNFDPNTLKDSLKAMAQGSVVRATTKLLGGPWAQAAVTADDGVAAATGKRPSKEISKAHTKEQTKLINDLLIKKKKQVPWAGSGPF
jgi:hypothetical protein